MQAAIHSMDKAVVFCLRKVVFLQSRYQSVVETQSSKEPEKLGAERSRSEVYIFSQRREVDQEYHLGIPVSMDALPFVRGKARRYTGVTILTFSSTPVSPQS